MQSQDAINQGRLWGWRARDWAEGMEPALRKLYDCVLDDCLVGEGTVLLDAGCGTGGAAAVALARNADVSGFDASEGFLAYAQARLPDAKLQPADLQAIPFPDESFEVVIAINSVQFTADPVAALRELGRVTNELIGIGNWARPEECESRFFAEAMAELLPKPPSSKSGPMALAAPGVLEALLHEAGLGMESSREFAISHVHADVDSAVRALMSSGPNHRASEILGEDVVEKVTRRVIAERFTQTDGSTRVTNYFRSVTASRRVD